MEAKAKRNEYPHKLWFYGVSMQYFKNFWSPFNEDTKVVWHSLELPYKNSPKSIIVDHPSNSHDHLMRLLYKIDHRIEKDTMDVMDSCHAYMEPEYNKDSTFPIRFYWIAASSPAHEANARASLAKDLLEQSNDLVESHRWKEFQLLAMAQSLKDAAGRLVQGENGEIIIQSFSKTAYLYSLDRHMPKDKWEYQFRCKEIKYGIGVRGKWMGEFGSALWSEGMYDSNVGKVIDARDWEWVVVLLEKNDELAHNLLLEKMNSYMEWDMKYRRGLAEEFLSNQKVAIAGN